METYGDCKKILLNQPDLVLKLRQLNCIGSGGRILLGGLYRLPVKADEYYDQSSFRRPYSNFVQYHK